MPRTFCIKRNYIFKFEQLVVVAARVVTTTQVPGAVGALHHHTAGVLEDLQVPFLGVPASEEATMFKEQEIKVSIDL